MHLKVYEMKIVVISSEDGLKFETPIVVEMFKQGLDIFHLRKPSFSEGLLEEYLCAIPEGFHCRIVLHSYHNLVKSYNVRGVHIEKRHKKHWFRTYFKTMYLKL
jgi:thiamine-phosphate pyrophosphorylase